MDYTVGICPLMCPISETKMRENQRLLHIFEIKEGTKRNEMPQADPKLAVKCFSRSAAGKNLTDPENLRPVSVLLETVNYLLSDVFNKKADWIVKYNFIMDRLRSVRQDMVIQNISRAHQIVILQPIIQFHAFSAYRSCEENIKDFDPYINNKHLQECLKRLLCMYDYYDHLQKTTKTEINMSSDFLDKNRPYFESLYLIFNLGDVDAINRILNLPRKWRTNLVLIALKISLNYNTGNYFKLCTFLKKLPIILEMMAYLHMSKIRRFCFKMMSVAYNSKITSFDKKVLIKLLLYNSENELELDCDQYGLKFNQHGVFFSKTDFKQHCKKTNVKRSSEIDEKLEKIDISMLLLDGDT